MQDFTKEEWHIELDCPGADVVNNRNVSVAAFCNPDYMRLIAAAPDMFRLLKLYAEGNCRDCKKRKKLARALLDRINNTEDHHD